MCQPPFGKMGLGLGESGGVAEMRDAPLPTELAVADSRGCFASRWPSPLQPLVLSDGSGELLRLPLPVAVAVIHHHQWWNRAFGNPLGYLPAGTAIERIQIDLPPLRLLSIGPYWLRGWMAPFLLVMTALSLWLRWRWNLV